MADAGPSKSSSSSSASVPRTPCSVRIRPDDLWSFFLSIRSSVSHDHFDVLYKLFDDYANQRMLLLDFEIGILEVVEKERSAVWMFNTMLKVLLGETEYLDRVRARLISEDTPGYIYFLNYLRDYNNGLRFFTEFKRGVRYLFHNHQDLWGEFDKNLDKELKYSSTDEEAEAPTSEKGKGKGKGKGKADE